METNIQLKEKNVLKINILDSDGKRTGEHLEIDVEDVSLPLRYQDMIEEHKKNLNYVKMSFVLIDKKENKQGKKVLSSNETEKLKVINEFYRREQIIIDGFLGEGATIKLLNGRKPYYTMFNDIMDYLEIIKPYLEKSFDNFKEKVKEKYEDVMANKNMNVMEG